MRKSLTLWAVGALATGLVLAGCKDSHCDQPKAAALQSYDVPLSPGGGNGGHGGSSSGAGKSPSGANNNHHNTTGGGGSTLPFIGAWLLGQNTGRLPMNITGGILVAALLFSYLFVAWLALR